MYTPQTVLFSHLPDKQALERCFTGGEHGAAEVDSLGKNNVAGCPILAGKRSSSGGRGQLVIIYIKHVRDVSILTPDYR